jgi:hypothetical protein
MGFLSNAADGIPSGMEREAALWRAQVDKAVDRFRGEGYRWPTEPESLLDLLRSVTATAIASVAA